MIEYWLKELDNSVSATREGERLFSVSKFSGGEQPENLYFVKYDPPTNSMQCDCPNRRRNAHINDKHGQMVAKWLLAGKPNGYFDSKGVFHGSEALEDAGDFEESEGGEEQR